MRGKGALGFINFYYVSSQKGFSASAGHRFYTKVFKAVLAMDMRASFQSDNFLEPELVSTAEAVKSIYERKWIESFSGNIVFFVSRTNHFRRWSFSLLRVLVALQS